MAIDAHPAEAEADPAALTISELDPSDEAAVDGALEVQRAALANDVPDFPPPCPHQFRMAFVHHTSSQKVTHFVARAGGEVVGYLMLEYPQLDNLDNAYIEMDVHPAHRRRGYGRAIYRFAVDRVRADGRKRILTFTPEALPDGEPRDPAGTAFAAAMGMSSALQEVRRRLDLTTVDPASYDAILAGCWPKADGYSLVRWSGPAPEEYVDDIARLDARLVTDAPMGDLEWEPENIDAARVRENEDVRTKQGSRRAAAGAVHDATGRLVALTALHQSYSHHVYAGQGITLVDPDHRGHKLGTIIKVDNLRHALGEWPELRYVDTWNAAVNDYMIVINEAVGFRAVELWHNWQQDI